MKKSLRRREVTSAHLSKCSPAFPASLEPSLRLSGRSAFSQAALIRACLAAEQRGPRSEMLLGLPAPQQLLEPRGARAEDSSSCVSRLAPSGASSLKSKSSLWEDRRCSASFRRRASFAFAEKAFLLLLLLGALAPARPHFAVVTPPAKEAPGAEAFTFACLIIPSWR